MILETNLLILTITITLLGKLGNKPYTKSAFELILDDVRLPFINISESSFTAKRTRFLTKCISSSKIS